MTAPRELRRRIVETGVRQWAETGAAEFSVARIARELGVSTASPYRHFADRDLLLVAVVAHAADTLVAAMAAAVEAAGPHPTARLRAAATVWVRHTRATRIGLAEFTRPEIVRVDDPTLRDACRRPVALVGELVGRAADDSDPPARDVLARDVLAVLHGFATMPVDVPAPASGADLARAAAHGVGALLSASRRARRATPDGSSVSDDQAALF